MQNECKRIWLYALVIEREARMQDYLIKSQISQAKLTMNELSVRFKRQSESISDKILNFIEVFHSISNKDMPEIEVIELSTIPRWVCADWNLYLEILSHIAQLAIKTSGKFGKIEISVSFFQLEAKADDAADKRANL